MQLSGGSNKAQDVLTKPRWLADCTAEPPPVTVLVWAQTANAVMESDTSHPTDSVVPVSYFLRIPNVGDRVNAALVEAASGAPTVHVSDTTRPHLLAIGSILSAATEKSLVWGSGLMHPDLGVGRLSDEKIHAVRGKLTRDELNQRGLLLRDVPLGDPGFLAPRLLGIAPEVEPRFRVGIVAHYVDRFHPTVRRLLQQPDVLDLNVHEDPEVFLRKMACCECVISSSLHGLIFAEAMGLPNLWVQASDDIAGDGFKFRDWFSTTGRPQSSPHLLTDLDQPDELADRAIIHESTIDADALLAAFPRDKLFEIRRPCPPGFKPASTCRNQPMPVFFISFNRGPMMLRTMAAVDRLTTPTDIVIHDNGSDDPQTIQILEALRREGRWVMRRAKIGTADGLNQVDETVQAYFANWGEPSRYVVTDCDVDVSIARPDVLEVYDELLNRFRRIACVGPMLRIRDIPSSYPLYQHVMNRHIEQFWHISPDIILTKLGGAAFIECAIDTTFALHRAGEPFQRLKPAVRVYEPFEALHLDWYPANEADGVYEMTSSSAISHWANPEERRRHENVELKFTSYRAVKVSPGGGLEIYTEHATPTFPRVQAGQPVPGYGLVSEAEREARLAHVKQLQRHGQSEVKRWSLVASHQASWGDRATALARMVRPGESVFEFGAGLSVVREALPSGCGYTGSDLAPITVGVIQYDLNAADLEPIANHDVALFSGVLEYVHDPEKLLRYLAIYFSAIICSYVLLSDGSPEELNRRRYSGWFTDIDLDGFLNMFRAAGYTATMRDDWNGQALFRFDREGAAMN
jgi:hypothetical protein